MQNSTLIASTEALLKRLEQDETLLDATDTVLLQTAEQMMNLVRKYRRLKDTNPEAAQGLKHDSYLNTPMKWVLKNQCIFISEGSLQLLWEGIDITKNAAKYYNNEKLGLNKGSKLAVGEHPHPTSVLKEQVYEEAPTTTTVVFLRYVLNRNIISWTSVLEDTKLRKSGLNSKTPDRNNIWARYEEAQIETFPLLPKYIQKNGHDLKINPLLKDVKKFKDDGLTYEEFKNQITY